MTWWRFATKAAERQLSRRRKVEPRINTLRTSLYYYYYYYYYHHHHHHFTPLYTTILQRSKSHNRRGTHSLRPEYSSYRPFLISPITQHNVSPAFRAAASTVSSASSSRTAACFYCAHDALTTSTGTSAASDGWLWQSISAVAYSGWQWDI